MSTPVYAVLIFNNQHVLTYSQYDLTEFNTFIRSKMTQVIEEVAQQLLSTVQKDHYYGITETIMTHQVKIYGSTFDRYCIVITKSAYPDHVAFQLLQQLRDNNITSYGYIDRLVAQYQDVKNVDKLAQIQSHLDTTKVLLFDSLDKLHQRQVELNELVDKTDQLVRDSEDFRIRINNYNRCCKLF